MAKRTSKILWCEQRKIFKVCLVIFQYYSIILLFYQYYYIILIILLFYSYFRTTNSTKLYGCPFLYEI